MLSNKRLPEPGQSWGILGGAFDPIHLGHVTLAREIAAQAPLDGVLLVPTFHHPFKGDTTKADFADRLQLVELAVAPWPALVLCAIERDEHLSGFTIDTVRALKMRYPDVTFGFIIGADNLGQVARWHNHQELLREVTLLAGTRPRFESDEELVRLSDGVRFFETQPVDLSSSAIRELIHAGTSLDELARLVGDDVATQILRKGLYR